MWKMKRLLRLMPEQKANTDKGMKTTAASIARIKTKYKKLTRFTPIPTLY